MMIQFRKLLFEGWLFYRYFPGFIPSGLKLIAELPFGYQPDRSDLDEIPIKLL
jgi:hypothetical protein